ncbi:MAG: glycosyltransferase family 2 protein [Desulfocapsa sp.]|nr:glycosyltransferase family 2 protein [Desulfocapsa sp.]
MNSKVAAIVVSHNSSPCLDRCLHGLATQEHACDEIVLVDSGSTDRQYLSILKKKYSFQLVLAENIGFSKANNLGVEKIPVTMDFVLFVNPDVFLPSDFIKKALHICAGDPKIGVVSGKLLAYNLDRDASTGRIDSTGIRRKWYGRWYDRGQGEADVGQYDEPETMAALCGALLFCRQGALQSLQSPVFDPDFFLYKEDIELSLRLAKRGWKLLYHPDLSAYHCRGWQNERRVMAYPLRKTAAQSEILLYKKHPSPYILWALLKFFLVAVLRL